MYGQLVGLGIQTAAGMYGKSQADKDKAEQLRLLQEALREYEGIELPDSTPETLGPSEFDRIQSDPEYRQAQLDALAELRAIAKGGGMTLADKANLNAIQSRSAQAEKSAREGIREQMAARGASGGGAELAMQLSAQQGSANRAAAGGLEVAAQAQKRALEAMLQRGRMAGDVRRQEWGEKASKATAADEVARYNAQSRERARQQAFGNRMSLAGAKAGARSPVAGQYGEQAQDTRNFWGSVGSGGFEAGRTWDEDQRKKAEKKNGSL